MPLRKIVQIDEQKCNGCGKCIPECAEGAIAIVGGKARLVADVVCDGLGACLGHCPEGAITIIEREAEAFDEAEVHRRKAQPASACAGTWAGTSVTGLSLPMADSTGARASAAPSADGEPSSALANWPIQLHLVPPTAPFLQDAHVLLSANCVPFAMPDFHERLLRDHKVLIACPKLDDGNEIYVEKLRALIDEAKINTLTVMIMEVPCCGGLLALAQKAAGQATRKVPVKAITVGIHGNVLHETWV